eukprot:1158672-Pelagomonas_calceolata.AAC.8
MAGVQARWWQGLSIPHSSKVHRGAWSRSSFMAGLSSQHHGLIAGVEASSIPHSIMAGVGVSSIMAGVSS